MADRMMSEEQIAELKQVIMGKRRVVIISVTDEQHLEILMIPEVDLGVREATP